MAEVITRFRVNVNGVEQDARVCYQNLANKPTFKTINGKAVVVSGGDTDTNFNLTTAEETAALRNRVTNLEQNGTGGGGGGSGTPYDDTEVRALITAEQNRATQQEKLLSQQINGTASIANDALSGVNNLNSFTEYAENTYATKADLSKKLSTSMFTDFAASVESTKQDKLISGTNIKTINNQSILGSGNITISGGSGGGVSYDEMEEYVTDKISAALAAIPVAEGGAY